MRCHFLRRALDVNVSGELLHVQVLRRGLIRLSFRRRLDIHCLEGVFWITQDGRRADIVIEPGQAVELISPGAAIVQALAAGRLCLRDSQ
jgi:hypothetical protein